jgi:hypothetical protein
MGCRVRVLVCIRVSLFLDGSAKDVVYEFEVLEISEQEAGAR